jgi:5S rRNA maturation endonuclease (ribonuclease M5)
MTECYIVVEGAREAVLIRQLLRPDFDESSQHFKIVVGGGYSSSESLTRSLLIERRKPVILIVDADSTDSETRQQFLESSIGHYVDRRLWKVFVVTPTLESLLFSDKVLLETLVGQSVSEITLIQGQYEPLPTLKRLLPDAENLEIFTERLENTDLTILHSHHFVQELRHCLTGFLAPNDVSLAVS